MDVTIFAVALVAYVAFHQWLRHQRRVMLHRERLVAVEKGTVLPAVEQEVQHTNWNIERILLLAGLSWISVGLGAFVILNALVQSAAGGPAAREFPSGIQWVAVAPIGIGLSHLMVYLVEKRRQR